MLWHSTRNICGHFVDVCCIVQLFCDWFISLPKKVAPKDWPVFDWIGMTYADGAWPERIQGSISMEDTSIDGIKDIFHF